MFCFWWHVCCLLWLFLLRSTGKIVSQNNQKSSHLSSVEQHLLCSFAFFTQHIPGFLLHPSCNQTLPQQSYPSQSQNTELPHTFPITPNSHLTDSDKLLQKVMNYWWQTLKVSTKIKTEAGWTMQKLLYKHLSSRWHYTLLQILPGKPKCKFQPSNFFLSEHQQGHCWGVLVSHLSKQITVSLVGCAGCSTVQT